MRIERFLKATTRRTAKVALYLAGLVAAVLATIVVVFAVQARLRLPDLQPWHRIALAEEFHAGRAGAPQTFPEYLALEERLFAELRKRVLDDPAVADRASIGRYNPKSVPAQLALGGRHNRSYELAPPESRGAVLLVHGLSDSPYSVRSLAEVFHARGFHVLVVRLPGHGTVPAGLVDGEWTDWYAVVELAARHAAQRAGTKPFYVGGYSTGAPLLALLSVRGLEDPTLPRPQRLFFLSAAIGVSKFAALANVASALSFLPYFEKAKWLDVLPEYDPYKYNSFTVNAGNQVFRLTRALDRELAAAAEKGLLDRMPRVTAFQSVVDATVSAADVVRGFLLRLPARATSSSCSTSIAATSGPLSWRPGRARRWPRSATRPRCRSGSRSSRTGRPSRARWRQYARSRQHRVPGGAARPRVARERVLGGSRRAAVPRRRPGLRPDAEADGPARLDDRGLRRARRVGRNRRAARNVRAPALQSVLRGGAHADRRGDRGGRETLSTRGRSVLGVDFTSAPRRAKPIVVARGRVSAGAFRLEAIEPLHDWPAFERLLAAPGPWIGGFDFPFGLPRAAVRDLGWPPEWGTLVRHCAEMGRQTFRATLDAYRATRAVGDKYPHRATDLPAASHSPIKLVNPPVALMFLEGAPRLAAAGVSIPTLRRGDPQRVAVEAYPGLAARAITRDSYKSDEARKQTPARRATRAAIVRALRRDGGLLGSRLEGDRALLRSLVDDGSGDRLDAVLAALQAAWSWRRRARNFGLPRDVDPLEGWIATARAG